MFNHNTEETDINNNNPYYTKKDGKLVITIGGKEFTFDSFSDFAYKMNAFESDLVINSETNSIDNIEHSSDRTPNIILNIDNIQLPVESRVSYDVEKESRVFDDKNSEEYQNTIELVKALLKENPKLENIIELMFGNNVLGIDILPKTFVYSKNDKHGDAKFKNGKIYITETGREHLRNNPLDVIRLLFHENFHDKFKDKNFVKMKK